MGTYLSGKAMKNPTLGTQAVGTGLNLLPAVMNGGGGGNGGGSGGGGGGGSAPAAAAAPSTEEYVERLQNNVGMLYESIFQPDPIDYTEQSEEQIAAAVAGWLRPGYEQAMKNRKEQTKVYGAELDADAIARGMGASTYVTDVKSRQQQREAEDIAAMESDYGAALAKAVYERAEAERDRSLDVKMYNNDIALDAYYMAYEAALMLMGGGGSGGGRRGGSSRRGGYSRYSKTYTTSAANARTFLSSLSSEERSGVYGATTEQNAAYRKEIIDSVGLSGYYSLMMEYH